LKFTPSGGSVKIVCKFIKNESDIDNEELKKYFLDGQKEGMIEISVTDSGIGIKKEDQSKLFKLFGYLDSSKAMNTKGIGLGLHISKMMSQQFGGDIMFKS
jgi:signal transduction histidine kinase